jgi:large subunit ribosomal protein L18
VNCNPKIVNERFYKAMKHAKKEKMTGRERRAKRIRRKVFGTAQRPRLSVFRSLKNIYAQLIDDEKGVSILGISSLASEIKGQKFEGGRISVANAVGIAVAEKAKEKGIKNIVFDRSGYKYHGRIRALAEGTRKGGLNF